MKIKSPLISMHPSYNEELAAESLQRKNYLTDEKRQNYLVTFENGVAYNTNHRPLNGKFIYVILVEDGENHCYAAPTYLVSNHSHIGSGREVLGAGSLIFKGGFLVMASNESGHYKPTIAQMHPAIQFFLENSNNPHLIFAAHVPDKIDGVATEYRYLAADIIDKEKNPKPLCQRIMTNSRWTGGPSQLENKENEPPKDFQKVADHMKKDDISSSINNSKASLVTHFGGLSLQSPFESMPVVSPASQSGMSN